MVWQHACLESDVGEAPHPVRIGTTAFLLVREGDAIHATDALCPHKFGPLEDGHVENGCLVCPLHDAHYSLANGTPREGDEWAGQLQTYPCRTQAGAVEINLPDS